MKTRFAAECRDLTGRVVGLSKRFDDRKQLPEVTDQLSFFPRGTVTVVSVGAEKPPVEDHAGLLVIVPMEVM
jgi:hypothetical protein